MPIHHLSPCGATQAGMGAWAFHSWQRHLPSVSLLPVELPGRNTRLREPCYTDLCTLAKDAVTALEPEIGRWVRVSGAGG
jgi:medium-chain acyl-[acyl-carrier-protein] hydrolase